MRYSRGGGIGVTGAKLVLRSEVRGGGPLREEAVIDRRPSRPSDPLIGVGPNSALQSSGTTAIITRLHKHIATQPLRLNPPQPLCPHRASWGSRNRS